MEEQEEELFITAADRCDKCGVQAYFLVIFDYGHLYFCRHHFMKNEDVLRDLSYHIEDFSELLAKA
jgi:hypothetical protein